MTSLTVRKIENEVYERLRERAAEHGVSMEEEARRILRSAVITPKRLGDLALEYFGPTHGADLELSTRDPHEPPPLDSWLPPHRPTEI